MISREKQQRYDKAYMQMAIDWAKLSYCKRKQVGCLLVKDRMIISDGYNGTPSGFENECEDETFTSKWYVLHAEANALMKIASSTQSAKRATLYTTLSPCQNCSKLILQAGISRVVYAVAYSNTQGLEFLEKSGIEVVHQPMEGYV